MTEARRLKAAAATRAWRKKNPERAYKLDTEKQFRKKYGITLNDYDILHNKQNGLCALCNKPESIINGIGRKPSRLAVDHDPTTKRIRGLLCFRCNTAIGQIARQNISHKIVSYLEDKSE